MRVEKFESKLEKKKGQPFQAEWYGHKFTVVGVLPQSYIDLLGRMAELSAGLDGDEDDFTEDENRRMMEVMGMASKTVSLLIVPEDRVAFREFIDNSPQIDTEEYSEFGQWLAERISANTEGSVEVPKIEGMPSSIDSSASVETSAPNSTDTSLATALSGQLTPLPQTNT